MSKQTLLEEEIFDEDYIPSDEEILEYALYLGMDQTQDQHLFWIARECITAPTPKGWKPYQTEEENVYYFNADTGESRWDHPNDNIYREKFRHEKQQLLMGLESSSKTLGNLAGSAFAEAASHDTLHAPAVEDVTEIKKEQEEHLPKRTRTRNNTFCVDYTQNVIDQKQNELGIVLPDTHNTFENFTPSEAKQKNDLYEKVNEMEYAHLKKFLLLKQHIDECNQRDLDKLCVIESIAIAKVEEYKVSSEAKIAELKKSNEAEVSLLLSNAKSDLEIFKMELWCDHIVAMATLAAKQEVESENFTARTSEQIRLELEILRQERKASTRQGKVRKFFGKIAGWFSRMKTCLKLSRK